MVIPGQVSFFVQMSSLINNTSVQEIGSKNNWTTPIASYLRDSVLPGDKEAARKLKVQVTRFILIKDIIYKRGFSRPYLRCLVPEEADYVMREVHEEIQYTKGIGLGQWEAIRQRSIQRLLITTWDQEPLLLARTPAGQWTG